MDWEHLDLALKSKEDMYRIWRSKQNSDFCGTRVQVSRYSGESLPDERCPNCGRRETAAHLMPCSDESRTHLLAITVEDMAKWMSKDNLTNPEIRYWIPKYILMRGSKPLAEMGFVSPQFKALVISQDIIGWREFTEGHILSHFYEIQSFYLEMSSCYLNGEDWTKQFISKILQITHSQWIFRNISFHNKKNGYLRNKTADELLQHINSMSEVSPEELPESSRFLLEKTFSELSKHHLETQQYWTLAVDAALKAHALEQAGGGRAKRVWRELNTKVIS